MATSTKILRANHIIRRNTTWPRSLNLASQGHDYHVTHFESSAERERKLRTSLGRSPGKMPSQLVHPIDEDESDGDEPLLSGSGDVRKECPEDLLASWVEVIHKWKDNQFERPKDIYTLIKYDGVPEILRGEVWLLLSGAAQDPELMDTYRVLIAKQDCPDDQVISRDIHRTFPAHNYFKEAGGLGQDALYKISKAYSLYDEEIGYCQGISFLAASLLLHMPEEQAFCVLVKIMFDYQMRDLFKVGFEALHLRFYQLERLIEDYIPDLYMHFFNLNIETHMYASQWFLTLFTAKFPLMMVFYIIDLFLSEGVNTIFHVSLALLMASKKDLVQLDFEGALKYFRVVLPRKFRTETAAKDLIQQAVKLRISHKKLVKYEKEYISYKEKEAESQDPFERLEKENIQLRESVLRLERENDDLAHEMVTSKIELRNNLDAAEDQLESLQGQLERSNRRLTEYEAENRDLHTEYDKSKSLCRDEMIRLEDERLKYQNIATNYKQICSDQSQRLEKQRTQFEEEKKIFLCKVRDCPDCSQILELEPGSSGREECRSPTSGEMAMRLEEAEEQVHRLELELAQTKLALVETQCRSQDLSHQLNGAQTELDGVKNSTWLKKAVSSIKEVASQARESRVVPRVNSQLSSGPGSSKIHSRQPSDASIQS